MLPVFSVYIYGTICSIGYEFVAILVGSRFFNIGLFIDWGIHCRQLSGIFTAAAVGGRRIRSIFLGHSRQQPFEWDSYCHQLIGIFTAAAGWDRRIRSLCFWDSRGNSF